ncbi:peptidase M43 [Leptolyngbya sp. 'hensonii']|uniref:zinc-dependent metalloprotease n=1 Tax=Leptolyngbya sp. 'hensonii' TaxID=1922337 RepID=UPI00094FFC00|nr:zinc-dependent metalloprotease [Leptolyngbya sp. 'hensonii']OLP18248.1 peptidase M43 [Leptolyngbya sp. 'hensonii']
MKRLSLVVAFLLGLCLVLLPIGIDQWSASQAPAVAAQKRPVAKVPSRKKPVVPVGDRTPKKPVQPKKEVVPPGQQPFAQTIRGLKKQEGLFTVYQNLKTNKLLVEIKPEQLNVNFLWTTTLESGIGERGIYSGLPISDFLFYFRRVNNSLQLTVRNVNFRVRPGDPLQRSINRSFSDSVLYALPIRSTHPQRKTLLVDLSAVLLSDFPGLSPDLSRLLGASYTVDPSKSYLGQARAFPLNVELESIYNFSSSGGGRAVETLPDSRALTLRVRYSLSHLPQQNDYQPRLADDRVGYFITAYQDFSNDNRREPFVRYINRWHLEKQDPTAPLSPPKKPIKFWIENTVPLEYRESVRDGILMWNKAFEKIGFQDAIVVEQMPDDATWDPADIRYNTIRWFNSLDATFAMGPSRVNPLTGQILDADIIVDASFIRFIKQEAQIFAEGGGNQENNTLPQLVQNGAMCSYRPIPPRLLPATAPTPEVTQPSFLRKAAEDYDLCYSTDMLRHFATGSLGVAFLGNVSPSSRDMQEYLQQFLKSLIAHEVGHTLGLRHNFHASAMLKPEELNDRQITRTRGLVSSVMDYVPPNLAPKGTKQGDYYTTVVGPYDEWAIEYGYRPIEGATVPQAELRTLEKIAQRAPEPDLAYATDEDLFSFLDPDVNLFDLSGDMVTYSRWQMENAREMWNRLEKRYPIRGESYTEARNVFDTILFQYFNYATALPQYIGGQSFSRSHAGDPEGRLPFQPVPLAQQRQALTVIQKYVFDETAFRFSPDLLNKLAPSRWRHWGSDIPLFRLDYPIYERVFMLQRFVLADLFSRDRLARLRDSELKARPGETLTLPELFDTLQTDIWREVVQPGEAPLQLSSLRRALQREYLETLSDMVLRAYTVPDDARTLAYYHLKRLQDNLSRSLKRSDLDIYTRAHFEESRDRITKTLNAELKTR